MSKILLTVTIALLLGACGGGSGGGSGGGGGADPGYIDANGRYSIDFGPMEWGCSDGSFGTADVFTLEMTIIQDGNSFALADITPDNPDTTVVDGVIIDNHFGQDDGSFNYEEEITLSVNATGELIDMFTSLYGYIQASGTITGDIYTFEFSQSTFITCEQRGTFQGERIAAKATDAENKGTDSSGSTLLNTVLIMQ